MISTITDNRMTAADGAGTCVPSGGRTLAFDA